ncbi:MAG: D-alanine--D-alanine ligase [Cellvibrionaceae bacterium]
MNSRECDFYVTPGMPPLDMSGQQTSFFEFWPTWAIYLPVAVQSLWMAVRYRSLTLPLIANPKLPLSGMVGVGKSELMSQATQDCNSTILTWFTHNVSRVDIADQVMTIEERMSDEKMPYPVVCKPDIGCRGVGVKLVHNRNILASVLASYPEDSKIIVQRLARWEPEAGVFYVRHPEQSRGEIISMAMKYMPYVIGDGKSSLRQLIGKDIRAGELSHLYLERHQKNLDDVIAEGETFRLIFAASHSRGAIFRDANTAVTSMLTNRIDQLMKQIPEFYYGRLDIKFRDLDSLKEGKNIEIVEINCASSESLHIWDRRATLSDALKSLLFQYRTLFLLGAENRRRGYHPPKLTTLLSAWKKERDLTRQYPETD